LPQIKDGKLRALAVTSKTRSGALPEVPTMAEAGNPAILGDSWVGALVPAGTPEPIVTVLNREIVAIIAADDMQERLQALGYEAIGSTPEQFSECIEVKMETWGKVIAAANIRVN
jgi:tripartite-type tricarboxylate transporter receptor subunit TctC